MSFSKLGLHTSLVEATIKQNYLNIFPIQEQAIPAILEGKDVLGIAKTGSGKTASFILPILNQLIDNNNTKHKNRHIHTLILVPTRELAIQIKDETQKLGQFISPKIKSLAVYGGVSINPQMINLQGVELIIATPGRLIELIEKKALYLDSLKTLVLDEADKLLNLGFKLEIEKILSLCPKQKQNLLFSATLNKEVSLIKSLLLSNPTTIQIEEEDNEDSIDTIIQTGYFVSDEKKGPLLRYIIRKENMNQVLVFTSSVFKADSVAEKLTKNGIEAKAIHSKKSQGARTEALNRFKVGKTKVLVTTDLLARGIDIPILPYVINYELPRSPKDFIHRIGRTGRAEHQGEAITFVTQEDAHHFKVIQKKMKKWVTMIDSESLTF